MRLLMYDEDATVDRLCELDSVSRVVFAACCAERLFPAYRAFIRVYREPDVASIREILDRLWMDLARGDMLRSVSADLEACVALAPRENDGVYSVERTWAEDASAILGYCLLAKRTGDPVEAMWAGRRTYEAADDYVTTTAGQDYEFPREAYRVLSHPLVQTELRRQRRDMRELARRTTGAQRFETVNRFRLRAQSEMTLPCAGPACRMRASARRTGIFG